FYSQTLFRANIRESDIFVRSIFHRFVSSSGFLPVFFRFPSLKAAPFQHLLQLFSLYEDRDTRVPRPAGSAGWTISFRASLSFSSGTWLMIPIDTFSKCNLSSDVITVSKAS